MGDIPSLTINSSKTTIRIVAKYKHQIVEHEILLKLVLSYYWKNDLPFIEKFMELLGSVIRRSLGKLFKIKKLSIRFNIESNDTLEESSIFKITILRITVDDVELELVGNEIILEGIDDRGTMSKMTGFRRKVNESFEMEFLS